MAFAEELRESWLAGSDVALANVLLRCCNMPEVLSMRSADNLVNHCAAIGAVNLLDADEDLLLAIYTQPGVYLLVVEYPKGKSVALYFGKAGRSFGARWGQHRRCFLDGTASSLVYSGSPSKVFAIPLFALEGSKLVGMYQELGGRTAMTPRHLVNCLGSLVEMGMIAYFETCQGTRRYQEARQPYSRPLTGYPGCWEAMQPSQGKCFPSARITRS